MNQGTPFTNNFIWNLRIPPEIKIFMCHLQRGVILTKDNLAKRNFFLEHARELCISILRRNMGEAPIHKSKVFLLREENPEKTPHTH
jgi:hypothetical protein